jgi:hypothetical protein
MSYLSHGALSYVVRVVKLYKRLSDAPLPRHIRYLSMLARSTTLHRTGPQTLEVEPEDDLFTNPELREIETATADTTVQVDGFRVSVLEDGPNAGPKRALYLLTSRSSSQVSPGSAGKTAASRHSNPRTRAGTSCCPALFCPWICRDSTKRRWMPSSGLPCSDRGPQTSATPRHRNKAAP